MSNKNYTNHHESVLLSFFATSQYLPPSLPIQGPVFCRTNEYCDTTHWMLSGNENDCFHEWNECIIQWHASHIFINNYQHWTYSYEEYLNNFINWNQPHTDIILAELCTMGLSLILFHEGILTANIVINHENLKTIQWVKKEQLFITQLVIWK